MKEREVFLLLRSPIDCLAAVKDILAVLSNSDGQFQDLHARAPSLPGLIQRLEDILSIQYDTREHGEVSDFDFIGNSIAISILKLGTELWNSTTVLRKQTENTLDKTMGQRRMLRDLTDSVRYMACLMLQVGAVPEDKKSQFRIFQTFLKATKFCIGIDLSLIKLIVETNTIDLASKLMERAAQVYFQLLGW